MLESRLGLFAESAGQAALEELKAWETGGIAAVAYTDERYPQSLLETTGAPPLLFVRGALAASDRTGVAVIGTRAPSRSGLVMASQVAHALVESGRTVISGLAAGIDTTAHTAALAAGGRSIAVLGTGLQHAYPAANAHLQTRVQVLVSQFWPEMGPSRDNFPKRNAVMSGISAATVIIEAGERSGARIQARHALAQGRPLFLMASLLGQAWVRTLASQAGVHIIHAPRELIDALDV